MTYIVKQNSIGTLVVYIYEHNGEVDSNDNKLWKRYSKFMVKVQNI